MTGTGQLSEEVSGATFDLKMNGAIGTLLHCSGDASVSKTCSLPLGTGSLTFDAMKFPIAAGKSDVNVDISLSSALPSALTKTKTITKATAKNGDDIFCMEVDSASASSEPENSKEELNDMASSLKGGSLKLDWKDCGDAGTKTKITGFTPATLTLGQKTTMTGTAQLSEEVSGATFDLKMNGAIGTLLHCSGDASVSKTCSLPLGTGSLTFDAMKFPIAAGKSDVNVDISLSSALPSALTKTKTITKATAKNGDDIFCMEVDSASASSEPENSKEDLNDVASSVKGGSLKLDWKDCGDASTKTKITGFTPATLTLG